MQAVSLRFSPALWRRGRGANLKPRLSQAASLATERPPRNMRLSLHPSLPRESTYKPLRDLGVGTKCEFLQGLKPNFFDLSNSLVIASFDSTPPSGKIRSGHESRTQASIVYPSATDR